MMRYLITLISGLVIVAVLGGIAVVAGFSYFGRGLPDYRQLADYEPPVMTRVHAGDGLLLAEYATEKRIFVPVRAIPRRVVQAVLSAEDKNFYSHPGVDISGVARAVIVNLRNFGTQRRPVGASTITQQVAKNFLLGNEVSVERKIREAILAFRIERAFAKDRILELYLNEIYLGFGSYGVAAAALNYFNKPLDQLSVAEAAFIAALPKAPNNYNPLRYPDAARARRDWVIMRMLEDGAISQAEADQARAEPLSLRKRDDTEYVTAEYFAEEVRRELLGRYGETQLYKGGLSVRTTIEPQLQTIADRALRDGLEDYDRRHGWRGPIARLKPAADGPAPSAARPARPVLPVSTNLAAGAAPATAQLPRSEPFDLKAAFAAVEAPPGLHHRRLAVVTSVEERGAEILLKDGSQGRIPLSEMAWARAWHKDATLGPRVRTATEVLEVGDVIAVVPAAKNADGQESPAGTFALSQIPSIEGGLVALDPHTGRVLAMSGGYDFRRSQFNRVTQAHRQPGSAFKPFVYLAALDSGFTPSALILDAPFVIDQGPGLPKWRPDNYTRQFYGPSTMRLGVENSRNLMTVRLAQTVGMEKVVAYAEKFGIFDKLPPRLSMALGAAETSLMRLTAAYGMLVNGGKRITPSLIDRIQDRHGRTVFRHDARPCPDCQAIQWTSQTVPRVPDVRPTVTDPASAYQMVSILQGAIERGTGRRVHGLNKPVAGKTGTTNDSLDAWFIGFTPDLVVGVFVGFDEPMTLGEKETGGSVAAPVFRSFMDEALVDRPATPFRIPLGIRLVRVSVQTGLPAQPGEKNVILEAFKPGTVPTGRGEVVEGVSAGPEFGFGSGSSAGGGPGAPGTGTGGLY